MKRTLVVFLGNARGGTKSWRSAQEHLLSPYNADLALLFGIDLPPHGTDEIPPELVRMSKYRWTVPDYHDWGILFEEAADLANAGDAWREDLVRRLGPSSCTTGGIVLDGTRVRCTGAIGLGLRFVLLHRYEPVMRTYDTIVLSRSDYYYGCPHPIIHPDEGTVWVPRGQDFGGVCDRHHVFNSADAHRVLNQVDFMVRHPRLVKDNIEKVCLQYFQRGGLRIERFPRVMAALRADGDTTGWSEGKYYVAKGYRVKYPKEWSALVQVCGDRRGPELAQSLVQAKPLSRSDGERNSKGLALGSTFRSGSHDQLSWHIAALLLCAAVVWMLARSAPKV